MPTPEELIVPTADQIRRAVAGIKHAVSQNPQDKADFARDPRGYLGDRGFNVDLQREFLREQGYGVAADCTATCASTGSCCCETL